MSLRPRIVLLLALASVPASVRAQADTLPQPGRVLRVTLPNVRHEGRIIAYQADTVVLDTAKAAADTVLLKIPRTAVPLAHLHTGVELKPYLATGAAGGGVLAYFVSELIQEDNGYAWGRREWQRFLVSTAFVAAGSVIGGAVGGIMAPDRWVQINIQPYPTGR